jgi:hypothetical protein
LKLLTDTFPECPICGSTKGYDSSGILNKYAKCLNCKSKWKLILSSGIVVELMLHELPKDGSAVYTIKNEKLSNKPLYSLLGQNYSVNFWKKLDLKKEINWDFLAESVVSEASGAVMLDSDEKLFHNY